MTNVEIVYGGRGVGHAGRCGRGFFFGFGEEEGEFFDGAEGDVAAVVAGEEGFAFEVEEEEGGGHVEDEGWPRGPDCKGWPLVLVDEAVMMRSGWW